MRTRLKTLCSLLAAIMVLSALSAVVSASTVVASGTDEGSWGFDYELYSDGTLKVTTEKRGLIIGDLPENVFNQITAVEIDITGYSYDGVHYMDEMFFEGSGCNAEKFTITTEAGSDLPWVFINGFPKLSGETGTIVFPEGANTSWLSLNCDGITSIDFLDGIDAQEFDLHSISIKEIDLSPYPVSIINLSGCSSLTDLTLPERCSIEAGGDSWSNGLDGCTKLKNVTLAFGDGLPMYSFAGTAIETLTLPSGIGMICDSTFKNCSELKSVYIPASVSKIALNSFDGCSSLLYVYYGGDEDQWESIIICDEWGRVLDGKTTDDIFGDTTVVYSYEFPEFWHEVDTEDGMVWKYFNETGAYSEGWEKAGGAWYYFDEDGVMQTGWINDDGTWYYLRGSGSMYTGWLQWGDSWYYLKPSGAMATGWEKVGGRWYLFNGSGVMLTGWQKSGGNWYYLESSGAMKTGWQLSGGKWYFLNSSGAMATGWVKSGNDWYYMDTSGAMITGWKTIGGYTYYFEQSGRMVTGNKVIDGKRYSFDNNGHCKNPPA